LFGFSSGAYTARALAGMIYVVGLLAKDDTGSVDAAYELYAENNDQCSRLFKETRSRPVEIDFVGVWETTVVSSEILPFTDSNPGIKTFRQALALDERRTKRAPLYYRTSPKNDSALEVWFSGGHDDIGGGPGLNKPSPHVRGRASLTRIALRWMVGECFDTDTGILFKADDLKGLFEDRAEDRVAAECCHIQDPLTRMQKLFQRLFLRTRVPPRILSPAEAATASAKSKSM